MRGVNYDDLHREAATLIESERKALAEAREALRPFAEWRKPASKLPDEYFRRARSLLQEPSDD